MFVAIVSAGVTVYIYGLASLLANFRQSSLIPLLLILAGVTIVGIGDISYGSWLISHSLPFTILLIYLGRKMPIWREVTSQRRWQLSLREALLLLALLSWAFANLRFFVLYPFTITTSAVACSLLWLSTASALSGRSRKEVAIGSLGLAAIIGVQLMWMLIIASQPDLAILVGGFVFISGRVPLTLMISIACLVQMGCLVAFLRKAEAYV